MLLTASASLYAAVSSSLSFSRRRSSSSSSCSRRFISPRVLRASCRSSTTITHYTLPLKHNLSNKGKLLLNSLTIPLPSRVTSRFCTLIIIGVLFLLIPYFMSRIKVESLPKSELEHFKIKWTANLFVES